MTSRTAATLCAAALAAAACGPAAGGGAGATEPGAGGAGGEAGRIPLDEAGFASLFDEGQAAYYIEWESTIWLVIRLTAEADEAEVLGHVFSVMANRFDFESDARTTLVLIGYKGQVGQRANYGIKVEIEALKQLQAGDVTIEEVTESAGYVMNADLGPIEPFISK